MSKLWEDHLYNIPFYLIQVFAHAIKQQEN